MRKRPLIMNTKHISEITHKTAGRIAGQTLVDDTYHNNIKNAANYLVVGGMDDYVYQTQFTRGTTVWVHGESAISVMRMF